MAAARRRGPAPIASFDHDVSEELPEIREDSWSVGRGSAGALAPPPERARSHSTPGLGGGAPRIDISRASSSSHHDSRDSSPELALFAGTGGGARLELGFREDGALELRSSTEELAFLEGAPGGPAAPNAGAPAGAPGPPPPAAPRRHSRKDSQGSEAALLAVSGRTSRISSVGSQCSAQSAQSAAGRVSRLSVVSAASGVSRSPSPHRMLLETSFCGPKPIETDPDACAAAVEECLLEIAKLTATDSTPDDQAPPADAAVKTEPTVTDARDRREIRTEATVESERSAPRAPSSSEKSQKETRNQQRQARSRERRDPAQPEVQRTRNKSKDIIRIKLKPSEEYDDDDDDEDEEEQDCSEHPRAARPMGLAHGDGGGGGREARRSPSPTGAPVSRKSSFCSLFKSRETIGSPDSPSDALRRKKSLSEGRSRSKSRDRDRSATPSSAGKLRGSVLSLFRTPRRAPASPAGGSRATSPAPTPAPSAPPSIPPPPGADKLKYYEESTIIHIPLRTPPDERPGSTCAGAACESGAAPQPPRPASAPQPRAPPPPFATHKPKQRTVLPDGSIIIPLRSPTDPSPPHDTPMTADAARNSCDSQRGVTAAVVEPRPAAVSPPPVVTTSPPTSTQHSPPAATHPTPLSPPSDRSESLQLESAPTESTSQTDRGSQKRRERLVFTTHVGSAEQVFSTQFSLTKTPSVTSEISESLASFAEERCLLRDTRIATPEPAPGAEAGAEASAAGSDAARDSSESEGSAEAGPRAAGAAGAAGACAGDAEARGLVVQESFEDELPYVPTTLPLERPLALPMVPIRERGSYHRSLASVERPRAASIPLAAAAAARMPAPALPPAPGAGGAGGAGARDKLHIRLPRRAQPARPPPPPPPPAATSTPEQGASSGRVGGGGGGGAEARRQWVDFAEVPERRQPAKRIETLPAPPAPAPPPARPAPPAPAREPVFSYVEPEECRCECHAQAQAASPEQPPAGCSSRRRRDDGI